MSKAASPAGKLLCIGAPPDLLQQLETLLAAAGAGEVQACAELTEALSLAGAGHFSAALLYIAADSGDAAALRKAAQQLAPLPVIPIPQYIDQLREASLQRFEQEAEELHRELQELQEFQRNVAIFAHEINSPLTGLLGFLQLIVEEVEEQEEDPDRAAMLRDSLEAATRIRRVMVKLHQITEPVYKKARFNGRTLLELSQHGDSIA